ncbi:hypothetical protein pdam_00017628, partial [Pocillopora damicornis]
TFKRNVGKIRRAKNLYLKKNQLKPTIQTSSLVYHGSASNVGILTNCNSDIQSATMATVRARDTTLDKPLSDACRKILRKVKRELVRDMDADAFLL